MKALQIVKASSSSPDGATAELTLAEVAKPTVSPGEALVRVKAAAINPSDVLNASGDFGTPLPRIPGRDYAGTVEDGPAEWLGKDVYGTSGGALSFTRDGTHAEYLLVPAAGLAEKPAGLTFAQAATVGVPFTTAQLTLRRARVTAKDCVLVTGASGAVGSAACQLAARLGCAVLSAARRETAAVNLAVDPEMKTAKDKSPGGKGPDVVVDTTGSIPTLKAGLDALAPGGRMAWISAPRSGSREMTIDMKETYRLEKELVGCNSVTQSLEETALALRDMVDGFEKGQLKAMDESAMQIVKFDDALEAYKTLKSGGHVKKQVIVF